MSKKRRNITIDDKIWEKMEAAAIARGISVSAYIRQLVIIDLKINDL